MVAFGVLIAVLSLLIGKIGKAICLNLFKEVDNASKVMKMLPQNKWLLFFTLLFGAGITEETVYRLIILSLFLKITNKPWVAVVLSSLFF